MMMFIRSSAKNEVNLLDGWKLTIYEFPFLTELWLIGDRNAIFIDSTLIYLSHEN